MNTKPRNLRQMLSILIIILLAAMFIGSFTVPRSLEDIAPEFDPEDVISCEVFSSEHETIPPLTVNRTYYTFSFDPDSEEYDEFIELLNSTRYRKKFSNLFNDHTHKITLNPDANIYFKSPMSHFEIRMYGPEITIGSALSRTEFVPRGGEEFQKSVVDFIFENATLVKKETN